MEIYVKIGYILFPYVLFSGFQTWFYQMRWFYPHRSFKQQVMTPEIRSHIQYLIQTYYILVLILLSTMMKNLALGLLAGFNTI